ncbi:hypothetical protein [Archangium lipolyticum]|uniref:hypothetical protein n=1 Tax=Archangium lipolyticum TaxID=2970465 RepID=UPI00214A549C|nr:hypothetical protein [Archangium lipolyticum]
MAESTWEAVPLAWGRGRTLLERAARFYDAPGSPPARSARGAWRGGFRGGAAWMAEAMALVRGRPVPTTLPRAHGLGVLKYMAALLAALGAWGLAAFAGGPLLVGPALALLAFYAVEAQMVFLFPLALDGAAHPFRASRALTRRAGGTLSVMGTVLLLAAVMLFGGLAGRGVVRCWCLGCLAVVLWYEELTGEALVIG